MCVSRTTQAWLGIILLWCSGDILAQGAPLPGGWRGTAVSGPPKGWTFISNATQRYETWTDVAQELPIGLRCSIIQNRFGSPAGMHIQSGASADTKFATVMQAVSASDYRGKRVRLSAQLRTIEVAGQAGLWMRIDDQNGKVLKIDDMTSRPVSGTKSWTRYDVVLDVPQESGTIQFGYLLAGAGLVKAAQFSLDTVDAATPTTANAVPATSDARTRLPQTPVNLDMGL